MKTQTQVQINLSSIQVSQHLYIEPDGFILRFFMSSSQVQSKPFKIKGQHMSLNKKFKIQNIVGQELQIWFCTTYNKLIAVGKVIIKNQGEQNIQVDLKLSNIFFVKLSGSINVMKRQIQKIVEVEPDEQLLKKQQDPQEVRRRKQQELRKQKQLEELQKLSKKQKKHAITITHLHQKDQPYI